VVAGLGNIYVSEALFRAGLSPKRLAGNVQGGRAETLVLAIKNVLVDAIAAGGSSLRDHRQPTGEIGYFQHYFAVYGRAGEACLGCTCDVKQTGGIERITQSGRSTFYCARKQR
jgi:formamidopyrimidine-DNA glycosylase